MVHWRWSIYKHSDTKSCKYLRVRAIVVPDRCQDDMSWGQDTPGPARPHIASFPPHLLCSVSVSVSLSHILGNLYMTKYNTDWLWLKSHLFLDILFWCCLIICNVGHVGAVVWRGPRERQAGGERWGEARLMPAFVSISDTTSQNTFAPPQQQRNNSVSIDFRWA